MALLAAFPTSSRAVPEQAAKLEFFESRIRPMFVKHCYECHSVESGKTKGGLLLDSRAGWQVGGESGPAIVPGRPEESLLVQAIRQADDDLVMPPAASPYSRPTSCTAARTTTGKASRYSTAWHYLPGDLDLENFDRGTYEDCHEVPI